MREFVDEVSAACHKIEQAYQEHNEQDIALAKTTWQLLEILPFSIVKQNAKRRLTVMARKQQAAEKEIQQRLTTLRQQLDYYGLSESAMVYFDVYDALKIANKRSHPFVNRYAKAKRRVLIHIFERVLFKELNSSVLLCRFFQLFDYFFKKDLTYHKIMRKMIKMEQQSCHYSGSYY